jgi:hypothetical protein
MSWLPEGRSLANFDLVPAVGTTALDRCTQQRRMHRAEVIFACVTPGSKHKHKTQGRTAPASSPVDGARLNYGKYLRRKYIAVARCMSARQALVHLLAAACVCPLQGVNLPSTSFITATRPRGAATWPRAEACGVGTPSRSKCPPRVRAEVWSEGKINGVRGQEQALFQCPLAGARWEAKEASQRRSQLIQAQFRATVPWRCGSLNIRRRQPRSLCLFRVVAYFSRFGGFDYATTVDIIEVNPQLRLGLREVDFALQALVEGRGAKTELVRVVVVSRWACRKRRCKNSPCMLVEVLTANNG